MQVRFIVAHNNQEQGPYTEVEVIDLLKTGELLPIDYYYDDDLKDWVMVQDRFNPNTSEIPLATPLAAPADVLNSMDAYPAAHDISPPENTNTATHSFVVELPPDLEVLPAPTPPPVQVVAAPAPALVLPPPVMAQPPPPVAVQAPPVVAIQPPPVATQPRFPVAMQAPPPAVVQPTATVAVQPPKSAPVHAPVAPPVQQQESLPTQVHFTGGVGMISLKQLQAGRVLIRLTDPNSTELQAPQEAVIEIEAGPAKSITWTCPDSVTAGEETVIEMVTRDAFDNIAPHFEEALELTIKGAKTVRLPAKFSQGRCRIAFTWTVAESLSLDLIQPDRLSLALPVTRELYVAAGLAHQILIEATAKATAGENVPVTVKAVDRYGNIANYNGNLGLEVVNQKPGKAS